MSLQLRVQFEIFTRFPFHRFVPAGTRRTCSGQS